MKAFYLTDAGKVRSHNEDSVTILKNLNNEYLMVVADGMGGHRKGEVASALALTHLGKRFLESPSIGSELDTINWLKDNINIINRDILEYAETHDDSKGMGTTIVVAILTKTALLIGNIGDSPGYALINDKLHLVTKPHTFVELLVDAGNITEEEAKNHPKKNVLMKALGVTPKVDMDIYVLEKPCDGILLCSDGLTNMLTDEQINKVIIDKELSIEEKVSKLIRKCNARGGTDNISVALLMNESGDN